MKKIPTLFVRDPQDRAHVLPEVNPGCEWVLAGEGVATQKYDGTCVMLDEDGAWWARREVRPGKQVPMSFTYVATDETTGKIVGWEPIADSPFAKFHAQAYGAGGLARSFMPGTYELIGPKVNGNPEDREYHELIPHGLDLLTYATPGEDGVPTDPKGLFVYMGGFMESLKEDGIEGIVWHHPDGRMVKLKVRDFA